MDCNYNKLFWTIVGAVFVAFTLNSLMATALEILFGGGQ